MLVFIWNDVANGPLKVLYIERQISVDTLV